MDRDSHSLLSVLCLLVWGMTSSFLAAQQSPHPSPPPTPGTISGAVSGPRISRVEGRPYSADRVTVTTQTLADGTNIMRRELVKVYRDSEGRTREEYFGDLSGWQESGDTPARVHIFDPVAGVRYELNARAHTAHKTEIVRHPAQIRPQAPAASADPKPPSAERPRPVQEDLGTQVFEGFEATGTRTTITIPAGAQGNDRPIEVIRENWYSPELYITVMWARKDPHSGETVMRLTNINRDEQPAELFQVPPDYTIEETQTVMTPPASPE